MNTPRRTHRRYADVRGLALLVLALSGCTGESADVTTLETFGYGWSGFNHRLSYAAVRLDSLDGGAVAHVGVVGGTSTTGVNPDLDAECDPDTCQEFPFVDTSTVTVGWGHFVAKGVAVGRSTAELEAGADGASAQLAIPLEGTAKGDGAVALIDGFAIDTDHLTSDALSHCYDPALGWHPTAIALTIDDVTIDGDTANVTVSAHFAAGNSLEEERVCVDEINELAVAAISLDVLVIAGDIDVQTQSLTQSASYELGEGGRFDPDEQPPPDPSTRPLDGDPTTAVFGFSAVDFAFHVGDPDGRGAYLRTLSFAADTLSGSAGGHATNYSPATQLSGFDYAFSGALHAITPGKADLVDHGLIGQGEVPAALDENGVPVLTDIELLQAVPQ